MVPIRELKSCREVYIERQGYRLSLAHPLQSFKLVQSTIERAFQTGFVPSVTARMSYRKSFARVSLGLCLKLGRQRSLMSPNSYANHFPNPLQRFGTLRRIGSKHLEVMVHVFPRFENDIRSLLVRAIREGLNAVK